MVQAITDEDFTKTVSNGTVMVDFWAPWCGPCKVMGPVFEQVSEDIKDVTFAKINIDENQDSAAKLGVRSIPTFVLFKDGEEVDRIVGAMPADQFKQKLKALLQ